MDEAPGMYPNLNDQINFRLNRIREIKGYFNAIFKEIIRRELMSKGISKYVSSFDYFDKSFY